ncbi:hypothetical protein TNIN_282991 [Trichonephila inaurata madagascariensis]|uniref:Uncharacterized protein n=1 Tax=Trichonephila inaurata madagascariensis TaxID=2747483 RepID=A0A8X6YIS7_9ARAC|nr:hypothetical protein TNIN_282991 [Trichonephila inaurata madagascariensis]
MEDLSLKNFVCSIVQGSQIPHQCYLAQIPMFRTGFKFSIQWNIIYNLIQDLLKENRERCPSGMKFL